VSTTSTSWPCRRASSADWQTISDYEVGAVENLAQRQRQRQECRPAERDPGVQVGQNAAIGQTVDDPGRLVCRRGRVLAGRKKEKISFCLNYFSIRGRKLFGRFWLWEEPPDARHQRAQHRREGGRAVPAERGLDRLSQIEQVHLRHRVISHSQIGIVSARAARPATNDAPARPRRDAAVGTPVPRSGASVGPL
jgi:hypothetical protein